MDEVKGNTAVPSQPILGRAQTTLHSNSFLAPKVQINLKSKKSKTVYSTQEEDTCLSSVGKDVGKERINQIVEYQDGPDPTSSRSLSSGKRE